MGSRQPGTGCLLLFLAPFFLVGLVAPGLAVSALAAGDVGAALPPAGFGLAFGGAASLVLVLARRGAARQVERAIAEAAAPREPWLRRPEWAARRITAGGGEAAWFLGGFALVWNAIAWTATLAVRPGLTGDAGAERYFVLLFPLIGVALLVGAVVSALRFRRYGVSVLELATLPAAPGRLLAGRIRTSAEILPVAGFRVVLSNLHRQVTGSGKNRSTSTTVLWQQEWMLPGTRQAGGGTELPFALPLPSDARETDEADSSNAILWTVEVEADVPGLDYQARFDVPVFRTAESETPLSAEELAQYGVGPDAGESVQPADSRIRFRRLGGELEVEFPAWSAPGPGLVMAGFALGILALGWGLHLTGAPLPFLLIPGVIGLVLLLGAGRMLLVWSRVTVAMGRLTVQDGVLGGFELRTRAFELASLREVRRTVGVQVGTRVIWDLELETSSGETRVIGRGIHSGREAEWLTQELNRMLVPAT